MNVKRIRRLMRLMPTYQKPNTSKPAKGHKTCPYLLGGLRVDRPNQVWCADISFGASRKFRMLAVIDDCTRECLCLVADTSLSGARVARELSTLNG